MANGNDFIGNLIRSAQKCTESANEKVEVMCNITQFSGEKLREEFLAHNMSESGKNALRQETKALYLDMHEKGLLDGKVPDLKLKDYTAGRKSQGVFEQGITAIKNAEFDTLLVGHEGKSAIVQKNDIGGKAIGYFDDNNAATIIEPRSGGFLLLDAKQNTFTVSNPKGEKTVFNLSENSSMAKKATELMGKLYNSSAFSIHWQKGTNFTYAVTDDK